MYAYIFVTYGFGSFCWTTLPPTVLQHEAWASVLKLVYLLYEESAEETFDNPLYFSPLFSLLSKKHQFQNILNFFLLLYHINNFLLLF
jgi:hypothetical protein